MVVYTPNTPVSTNFPADDQPNMTNNSLYLQAFGDKDHIFSLNSALGYDGYHRQVSLRANLGASPKTGDSVGVVYPKLDSVAAPGPYSQLFFDNGTDAQLTTNRPASGPNAAVPSYVVGPPSSGVSYLPGGLLIQWGTGLSGATITFPCQYGATFLPVVTVTGTSVTILTPPAFQVIPNASNFEIRNNSGQVFSFQWISIGPA